MSKNNYQLIEEKEPEIPDEWKCPISKEIMLEPVILAGDGKTYDRASLEDWFDNHDTLPSDPSEKCDTDDMEFIKNTKLHKKINKYLEKYGKKIEENEECILDDEKYLEQHHSLKMLECRCKHCGKKYVKDKTPLYACSYKGCLYATNYVCTECGNELHKNLKINKHKFTTNVLALSKVYGDIKLYLEKGKQKIIKITRKVTEKQLSIIEAGGKGAAVGGVVISCVPNIIANTAVVGMGFGLMFTVDLIVNGIRLGRGDICPKEYFRRMGKSLVQNGLGFGIVAGATAAGAAIGSVLPGLGTVAGAIIGAVVGSIGAAFASYGSGKLYDKLIKEYKDKDEIDEETLMIEAFVHFGFKTKDVLDNDIFTAKEISKRFRRRALEVHPDRKGGDDIRFNALQTQYTILIGVQQKGYSFKKLLMERLEKNKGNAGNQLK